MALAYHGLAKVVGTSGGGSGWPTAIERSIHLGTGCRGTGGATLDHSLGCTEVGGVFGWGGMVLAFGPALGGVLSDSPSLKSGVKDTANAMLAPSGELVPFPAS